MSKLAITTDLHGKFGEVIDVVNRSKPKALLLAGDLDLQMPLDDVLKELNPAIDVYFIPGNHDTDRQLYWDNLITSKRCRSLHGRVVEIAGIRVAGLGGVFREAIWHPEKGGPKFASREDFIRAKRPPREWEAPLTLKHNSSIWWEDYERLFDQRADILITHEAPSCHKYGQVVLDDLAEAMGVKRHFHGHHHIAYQTDWVNGVTVHGIARCGVVNEDGKTLFAGLGGNGRPWVKKPGKVKAA